MTTDAQTRRVGFIGLGRMGMPMCARLVECGHAATVFDLRPELESAAGRLGAQWAASAAAAVEDAHVVITMLPGAREVARVIDEVVSQMPPTSTWIDMSTASLPITIARATAAAPRGLRLLDAPVGGGPDAAREGRLIAFVGGTPADLDTQRGVLDSLADRVIHVGAGGAGYTVKLLVNLLWCGQAIMSTEALALAQHAGVTPEALCEAVGHSAAASGFMTNDAAALLAGDDLSSYSLARICEQMATVLRLGADLAVPLELGTLVSDLHHRALAHYGDVDGELLGARLVAERTGLTVTPGKGS